MYTELGSSNVPAFLTKLWKLVEDYNYNDLISWSNSGKSFIIRNQAKFSKELLPLYFKHNNMASFIRQLNMYGFRKIAHIENSGLKQENDEIEFYHSCFIKDQESLLEFIKRKNSLSITTTKFGNVTEKGKKEEVQNILSDVKGIKGKQETIDNLLVKMQCENEALWREIAILRHKHQKQQKIVAKLIHFLVTIVHSGSLELKRKLPLMIDNKNGNNSKQILTSILSNSGPVIHEISNNLLENDFEVSSPSANSAQSLESVNSEEVKESSNFFNKINYKTNTNNNQNNYLDPLQQSINAINETEDIDLLKEDNVNLLNDQILCLNKNLPKESRDGVDETNQTNDKNNSDILKELTGINNDLPEKNSNLKLDTSSSSPKFLALVNNNNSLVPSTSSSVLNTPNITFRNFDDQLDGIDVELNNLQEQLLQGGCIDANVLMGLFSVDDANDCIENTEIVQVNTPKSLPAITILESVSNDIEDKTSLNSSTNDTPNLENQIIQNTDQLSDNFDLSSLVNNDSQPLSTIDYDTTKDLFVNQSNLLNGSLIGDDTIDNKEESESRFDSIDNTSMFDTDDLLSTEAEINQLLSETNTGTYCNDKKRRKIT